MLAAAQSLIPAVILCSCSVTVFEILQREKNDGPCGHLWRSVTLFPLRLVILASIIHPVVVGNWVICACAIVELERLSVLGCDNGQRLSVQCCDSGLRLSVLCCDNGLRLSAVLRQWAAAVCAVL